MQNINELIGIIKGINFDGVINDKEVLHLQSWVDKNRNLAYDKQQMELIKMVDSVLEDHIIDDSEKKMLITVCEEFLKDERDGSSHIYELNGIIEGIVCDGEVNEAEILRLKDWMDVCGESIRDHKPSADLCKLIDEILEDGVVTEEEQVELLDMLSIRIKNAQFETKLAYLCKLVREKKNIGTDLIDILNNASAMNEIHSRAESNLMQAVGSYSGYCRNPEIVVVSLVLIAMLEYDGKTYSYYLPFDFGFHKLSGCDWCSQFDDLWIDDLNDKSVLTLYDSECDGLLLYTESGTLAEDDIKLIDKGYYKQLPVSFLNSYKNGNRFVTLVFTANGKEKYAVTCYNKCIIDEEKTEIICFDNPKKVTITPVFHGKNKVFYELFNSAGEKILTSKLLESGQTSTLINFKSFKEYIIQFHEKTKILQLRKNTLLLEKSKTFYAQEDFVGRSFKITEAYFNQTIRGEFIKKQWFFNKYYLKLTDVIDVEERIFEGQIYSKSYKGDFFLYNINPVEVEICSDVIDDTMDIYITNQGDGLLFDPENRGILNSMEAMEHRAAPDIFLYTISMKGEDE